jgi:hypothetical protein
MNNVSFGPFRNFLHYLYSFKECVSGIVDFQDISGLAISGLENFEN